MTKLMHHNGVIHPCMPRNVSISVLNINPGPCVEDLEREKGALNTEISICMVHPELNSYSIMTNYT